jgi:HEAT repeat protein
VRLASVIVLRPKPDGRTSESVDGATALMRAIDERDSDAQQHLVEQLNEQGNEEELARAADALAGSLDGRQSRGYFETVKALDALDRKRAARELEDRLKREAEDEEEARSRAMAARGLGLIGSTNSVAALEDAATSDDPALRVAANKSLEQISCASSPGGCDATSDVDRTLHGGIRPELP